MQVTTEDGKTFSLKKESAADAAFIDALHLNCHCLRYAGHITEPVASGGLMREVVGVRLIVDPNSLESLRAEAGRQAVSSLRELASLLGSEDAGDGPVLADATHPEPQKQLSTHLEELQLMLDAGSRAVRELEAVVKEMQRTHVKPPVVEAVIVVEGGAA